MKSHTVFTDDRAANYKFEWHGNHTINVFSIYDNKKLTCISLGNFDVKPTMNMAEQAINNYLKFLGIE